MDPEQEEPTPPRPPHGIFCFGGDAYQALDVLGIFRFQDDDEETYELTVQMRGIQERPLYKFNSSAKLAEAWKRAVSQWCAASLAARGIAQ